MGSGNLSQGCDVVGVPVGISMRGDVTVCVGVITVVAVIAEDAGAVVLDCDCDPN